MNHQTDDTIHPLVSIVIVNYNGGDVLPRCLESVFAQSYRPVEVLLVDNGSGDGSPEAAEAGFPELRILRNSSNLGFAAANNQGTDAARGDLVVLLNNDTEVQEGWVAGLLAMFSHPGSGAVTSRVVTDGVPDEYYAMNGTINYLGYNIMRHFSDLSRVFFAGGASLMFRKSEVGRPFPDLYFLYHEDVFLSWRLRLMGKDIRMAQDSVVFHRGSVTTARQPGRLVTYYQERNRLLNALIMYEGRTLLLLLPWFAADAAAKLLLSLAGRKSTLGILRSYFWIIGNNGWIRKQRAEMQRTRMVPDRAILPLMSSRMLDGTGPGARLINGVSAMYARLAGWTQ